MNAPGWHSRPSAQVVKAEENDSSEPPWRESRARKQEARFSDAGSSARVVKTEENNATEQPPWKQGRPRKQDQQEVKTGVKEELNGDAEQPLKKRKLLPQPSVRHSKEKLLQQLAAAEEEERTAALHKERLEQELIERRNRDRAVEEQKQKLLQDLEDLKKAEEEERARERARKRAEEVQAKVRERRKKAKEEEEAREKKKLEDEVARLSLLEEEFDRQNEDPPEAPVSEAADSTSSSVVKLEVAQSETPVEFAVSSVYDGHVSSTSSRGAYGWNDAIVPYGSLPANNYQQEYGSSASWPALNMQQQYASSAAWVTPNVQSVQQELDSWAAANMQQQFAAHSSSLPPPHDMLPPPPPPPPCARIVPRPPPSARVVPPASTPCVVPPPVSGAVIHGLIRQTADAVANVSSTQSAGVQRMHANIITTTTTTMATIQSAGVQGMQWQGSHMTSPEVGWSETGWSETPAGVDNERGAIIRDVRSYFSAPSPSASSSQQSWGGWETSFDHQVPEQPVITGQGEGYEHDTWTTMETNQEVESLHSAQSGLVTTWRVLPPRLTVREVKDLYLGKALGTKPRGTCVKGVEEGEWLALTEETGYVLIKRGTVVLLERIDSASHPGEIGDTEAVKMSADDGAQMESGGETEAVETAAGNAPARERYTGIVKDFFANASFAIINSPEVFEQFRKAVFVTKPELDALRPGERVSFHVEMNRGRVQAVDIERIDENEQEIGSTQRETKTSTERSTGDSLAIVESRPSYGQKGHGDTRYRDMRYTGRVKPFVARSSFAFIASPEILEAFGRDVFATKPELDHLTPDQEVSFRVEMNRGRPQARDIETVDRPQEESGQLALFQEGQGPTGSERGHDEEGLRNVDPATDVRYKGTVKPFGARASFAFITSSEILDVFGKDVFVTQPELRNLTSGLDVSFRVEMKRGRPHACDMEDTWGNELGPQSAEIDSQQEQQESSSSFLSIKDKSWESPAAPDGTTAAKSCPAISWRVNGFSVVIREKKDSRFGKVIGCKTKGTCLQGREEEGPDGDSWVALADMKGYILIQGDNVLPLDGSGRKVDTKAAIKVSRPPVGNAGTAVLRYTGVVKEFSSKGSFGWITSNEILDAFGRDAFVFPPELDLVKPGQHVSFRVEMKLGRPRALDIEHIHENNGDHKSPVGSARKAGVYVVQSKQKGVSVGKNGAGKGNSNNHVRYAGTVKPFNERSSFAFIASTASSEVFQVFGKEVFVFGQDLKGLTAGQEVAFSVVMNRNRPQAVDITSLEKEADAELQKLLQLEGEADAELQ